MVNVKKNFTLLDLQDSKVSHLNVFLSLLRVFAHEKLLLLDELVFFTPIHIQIFFFQEETSSCNTSNI